MAESSGTPSTGVGCIPSFVPSTSSRFEAGSVLTRRTRLPASAIEIAVAQAMEVLPTPPLAGKQQIASWVSGQLHLLLHSWAAQAYTNQIGRARFEHGARLVADADETSELLARRILALCYYHSIDEYHRQAFCALRVQCLLDGWICRKCR